MIHYEGNIEGDNVEIEFLTDRRGATGDAVIEVQKGLHAVPLRFVSIMLENCIEVDIDDLFIEGKPQALKISAPSPEAYIFHKGLIFDRQKEKSKKAKDLYYIFDILANCDSLQDSIICGMKNLKKEYSSWFNRFEKNLGECFRDLDSKGVTLISSQRPAYVFPEMTGDQFSQYVMGIFQNILSKIS